MTETGDRIGCRQHRFENEIERDGFSILQSFHDFAGILGDLLERLLAVEVLTPSDEPDLPIRTIDHQFNPLLRSTGLESVPMPEMEMSTRSPGAKVKESGGTMPVPVIRNAPFGKEASRYR